jgi:hypothetical protein
VHPSHAVKVTPGVLARAQELLNAGVSKREIPKRLKAEGLAEVSRSGLFAAMGRAAKRGALPAPAQAAKTKTGATKKGASPATTATSPEEILEEIRVQVLPELQRMRTAALGAGNVKLGSDVIKLSIETAKSLIAARPPDPPNPEDDPANAEARDAVRAMLASALAETAPVCTRCGVGCLRCAGVTGG